MPAENSDALAGPRQDIKEKYLVKLLPVIKQRGLNRLRVEDIVRYMDISKATFYKYFSSKEEVIEQVVDMIVAYFQRASSVLGEESVSHLQRFQHAFEQAVFIASYLSEAFMLDLRQLFPPLWERINQAQQARQRQLQQFYEQGSASGVFQPLNPVLVTLQNELLLRRIMDPIFLMEQGLTLRALLNDYYELQKYQWLAPDIRTQLDDAPVKEYIDKMAHKISLGIRLNEEPASFKSF
ncbi:MAG: TetR/AcrR family transcriptional regulator [Ktedonobacteraceae bacterium]